jgi:hypothetical protein
MTEPSPFSTSGDLVSPPTTERVAVGLLAALGAVLAGVVLTVVIWRAGFIASITSLVIAIGATWLYTVRPVARRGADWCP